MSLYKITNNSYSECLTAIWNTNNIKSSINFNKLSALPAPIIPGFDIYPNIPILFSNDRITQNSKIITSKNNLSTQINEKSDTVTDINAIYINNNIINKIILFKEFNN